MRGDLRSYAARGMIRYGFERGFPFRTQLAEIRNEEGRLVEFIGTFFLVLTIGCTVASGDAARAAGDRRGADGDGLRRRPHLRRALQPGGHAGRLAARTSAPAARRGCPTWSPRSPARRRGRGRWRCSSGRKPRPPAVNRELDAWHAALVAEFLFTFALVLRRAQRRHRQGDDRQFVLRPGDRLHRAGRRVRRWRNLRRRVQSGRRESDPTSFTCCSAAGRSGISGFIWSGCFAGGAAAAYVFKLQNPEPDMIAAR